MKFWIVIYSAFWQPNDSFIKLPIITTYDSLYVFNPYETRYESYKITEQKNDLILGKSEVSHIAIRNNGKNAVMVIGGNPAINLRYITAVRQDSIFLHGIGGR